MTRRSDHDHGIALPRSSRLLRLALVVVIGSVLLKGLSGQIAFLQWAAVLPPELVAQPSKTQLSLWRVANVLALAYLIAVLVPASARWLSAAPAAVIAVLGRRSLPVFALGTVLSVAGTIALTEAAWSTPAIIAVNAGGILALIGTTLALDWADRAAKMANRPAAPARADAGARPRERAGAGTSELARGRADRSPQLSGRARVVSRERRLAWAEPSRVIARPASSRPTRKTPELRRMTWSPGMRRRSSSRCCSAPAVRSC